MSGRRRRSAGARYGAAEAVERRVHLVDLELVGTGVDVLDDAVDAAPLVADHPAVAARVVDARGEDRRGRVAQAVLGGEHRERVGADERRVGEEHEQVVVGVEVVGERGERDADCVAGAALHVLLDELDGHVDRAARAGEALLHRLRDVLGAVPDDDDDAVERQRAEGVEHPEEHRATAQLVEHLRGRGPHARALACREHDRGHGATTLTASSGHPPSRPLARAQVTCGRCARPPALTGAEWLGGEVSNLDLGLQRTPCCRYTTPDRGTDDDTRTSRRNVRGRHQASGCTHARPGG